MNDYDMRTAWKWQLKFKHFFFTAVSLNFWRPLEQHVCIFQAEDATG